MAALLGTIIAKYDKNKDLSSNVIKLLVENQHSQVINRMHKNGVLPMMEAIKKGNPQLVQDLLLMNPNIEQADKSSASPWDMAYKVGKQEIIKLLTDYRANSMSKGNGNNGYMGANMQTGQPPNGKPGKGDSRRGPEPNNSGTQYSQAGMGNNFQMNQGWLVLILVTRILN